MYLKSLVLKGFKSFADRSVLSLEPGITAIVGPNGSGKSNILDAVLWVLGERNARNLRGQAMEDVIFAGSATRKPVNVAEVSLVLDNGDQTLPVDFEEVAVTRRMYRTGESEYLINGTVCRRMDIIELLHDSGLGTGTHSIISQGHLDAVLQSKPADRRALIEEAAGVLKHKQRKEKSARKLERMEQHLLRVRDVTAEVERQLKPLARKARKAQTYQQVSAELTDLSLRLAVDDLRALQKRWDEVVAREKELKEALNKAQLAAYASDNTVRDLQRQLKGHEQASGKAAEGLHKLQSAAQRLDSASMLLAEKRRSAARSAEESRRRLADDQARLDAARHDFQEAQESYQKAKAASDAAAAEEKQAQAAHEKAKAALAESQRETARLQADQRKLTADRDRLRNERDRNAQALAASMADDKTLAARQDDLEARRKDAARRLEAARFQAEAAKKEYEEARASETQTRQVTGEALRAVEQARPQAKAAQVQASKLAAHAAALQEAEDTRRKENRAQAWANVRVAQAAAAGGEAGSTGAGGTVESDGVANDGRDARAAGRAVQTSVSDAAGTAPALVDVLGVPEDLAGVVDGLLGDVAQAAFAPDAAAAREVLQSLAQSGKTGTAYLLVRSDRAAAPALPDDGTGTAAAAQSADDAATASVRSGVGIDAAAAASDAGGEDAAAKPAARLRPDLPTGARFLIDLLECPAAYRPAVQALLGQVVVCDTWETADRAEALRATEPAAAAWRIVTRDGYLGEPDGLRRLVVPEKGSAGAVERHRRLEQARTQARQAERQQEQAVAVQARAEERLREAQKAGAQAATAAAQAQGRNDSAQAQLADADKQVKALQAEHDQLARKRSDVAAVLEKVKPAGERIEAQLQQAIEKLAQTTASLEQRNGQQQPLQQAAVQASERYTQARLEAGTLAERATYAQRMVASRKRDIDQLQGRIDRARALQQRRRPPEALDPAMKALDLVRETITGRIDAQERSRDAAESAGAGVHARIDEARRNSSKLHGREADATSKLADLRVEKGRLEVQVQTAVDAIEKDRSTPLDRAMALPAIEDREQAEIQVDKLRRRIKNMGAINPDAAAEYEQLKSRYDYLKGQTDDLLAARASLHKIVAVIDERMKDDFVDTYAKVDANFQEIFSELFPGGSAHLSLEDPDDPEHTGVEVHAQPRGKRIAKLSLMSGGEKSLTALALLFAVYKTRATPFYILDEVEAALDDTNLRRLCAYWQKMRTHTQLIMITHQRRTMEMADVLYGISMQSDGVTKLLSQRLDQAMRPSDSPGSPSGGKAAGAQADAAAESAAAVGRDDSPPDAAD